MFVVNPFAGHIVVGVQNIILYVFIIVFVLGDCLNVAGCCDASGILTFFLLFHNKRPYDTLIKHNRTSVHYKGIVL